MRKSYIKKTDKHFFSVVATNEWRLLGLGCQYTNWRNHRQLEIWLFTLCVRLTYIRVNKKTTYTVH